MALVKLKRSCDLIGDISRKLYLIGCIQNFTTSASNAQRWAKGIRSYKVFLKQSILGKYLTLIRNPKAPLVIRNPVVSYLAEELNIPLNVVFLNYLKFTRRKIVKQRNVVKTLKFLRRYGFADNIIAECVIICFYPSEKIQEGLKAIQKNEDMLNNFGLKGGFTAKKTENFVNGTVEKDKRLQLCLYYLESSLNFTGCLPFAMNKYRLF